MSERAGPAPPKAWHVGRTMRVLELLAFAPLSAPQLAAEMHAQPRTVRRVLARLEQEGYVRVRRDGRRVYEPTMRLVALAGQIVENALVVRDAQPYVRLLHEQTSESAHLAVPSYRSVLCVVHVGDSGDRGGPGIRELVPAHCTAGGKALLAWRAEWRDSLLATPLERFTDRTIVDPAALRRDLERVREVGHAVEEGEFQAGVRAASVPIVVHGEAIGALTVSGPDLDVDAVLGPLHASARELTARSASRPDGT